MGRSRYLSNYSCYQSCFYETVLWWNVSALFVLSTVLQPPAFPHSLKSSIHQEPICEKNNHSCDQGSVSSEVFFFSATYSNMTWPCAYTFKHGTSSGKWEVKKPSWALLWTLFLPWSVWSFCNNCFTCSGYSNENLLVKICESIRATAVTFLCCWAVFCTLALWWAGFLHQICCLNLYRNCWHKHVCKWTTCASMTLCTGVDLP